MLHILDDRDVCGGPGDSAFRDVCDVRDVCVSLKHFTSLNDCGLPDVHRC